MQAAPVTPRISLLPTRAFPPEARIRAGVVRTDNRCLGGVDIIRPPLRVLAANPSPTKSENGLAPGDGLNLPLTRFLPDRNQLEGWSADPTAACGVGKHIAANPNGSTYTLR